MRHIESSTSERQWWRALTIASGMALGTISGCTTPSGELGGVGESETTGEDETDTEPGNSGSDGGTDTAGTDTGDDTDTGEPSCDVDVAASEPRLLTRVQYANTIRDLFGVSEGPWTDPTQLAWSQNGGPGGPFDSLPFTPAAEANLAALAPLVAQGIEPAVLLPCAVDTPDPQACAETLIPQLGRAVWRRPLTADETASLLLHYDGLDVVEGTRVVVEQLLASPEFYMLREQGTPTPEDESLIALDEYSLATRLSYFLWGSTPDATLLARADAGELSDPALLLEEAQRLMADPRASATIGEMYVQWTNARKLDALDKTAPEFDAALGTAMENELRLLTADIVLGSGDGRLATLLEAPYTFINDGLGALYGMDVLSTDGSPGPSTFVRAELDPDRRGGLMTLPGLMAKYSHNNRIGLSRRGMLVRETLLCQGVPPPPPDVILEIPVDTDRYEFIDSLKEEPTCGGCHQLLDGPHLAFEHYDELGRWQTEINGQPVQTDGELAGGSSDPLPFTGRADLMETLSTLPETRTCVVDRHLRFALRRNIDENDSCTLDQLTDRMSETDDDLADLLVSIIDTEAFGLVRPE